MKGIITYLFLAIGVLVQAQDINTIESGVPQDFAIKDIKVSGTNRFDLNTILIYSGLRVSDTIQVPGDQINNAITKLWKSGLFRDVNIYATQLEDKSLILEVNIVELPQIKNVTLTGDSNSKKDKFVKDNQLTSGKYITDNLIATSKYRIQQYYKEKGFPDTKVDFKTKLDSTGKNADIHITIEKDERVKIGDIIITGNSEISDKKIRKAMKKTKKANPLAIFRNSKLNEELYKADLKTIIDRYQERGFRDAEIVRDTIYKSSEDRYTVEIDINEGNKYYIGDVKYVGNSHFTTDVLQKIVGFEKGEPYDLVGINNKISSSDQKNMDISTLYLDNGYLFSNIQLVESKVSQDSVDIEIRISEGEQATIDRVTLSGNDVTNDHVVFRELKVVPGDLFNKTNIIRSIRELSQLGFFDPEAISPDVQPNPQRKTVDIGFNVTEKGSSQIELQGGYGGGRFIGTLGLTFNNFSFRNLFKKDEWRPVPRGDGQSISLRAQASAGFTNYSISFTEPWLGGRKPTSLTVSTYYSSTDTSQYYSQFGNSFSGQSGAKLDIVGASVGLTSRLNWPDSYFFVSNSLNFQYYNFDNYPIFSSTVINANTGVAKNLFYALTIGRNSSGPNPIYPQSGSNFSISGKFTPPSYTLFHDKPVEELTDLERLSWLDYYKVSFKGEWFKSLTNDKKLVLRFGAEGGYLNSYSSNQYTTPFERFYVGGVGLAQQRFDGREIVTLRGYEDASSLGGNSTDITPAGGGTLYNKFLMELRYPVSLSPSSTIYLLTFAEAGNTYAGFTDFDFFDLKRSAGIGIRIFLPAFGLLGIDFAHGFDNYPNSTTKSGWQTHFIIGQNF